MLFLSKAVITHGTIEKSIALIWDARFNEATKRNKHFGQ